MDDDRFASLSIIVGLSGFVLVIILIEFSKAGIIDGQALVNVISGICEIASVFLIPFVATFFGSIIWMLVTPTDDMSTTKMRIAIFGGAAIIIILAIIFMIPCLKHHPDMFKNFSLFKE